MRSEFNERVSEASMRRSSSEDSEREEGLWRPSAASIASMPGVDTSEARHSQEQLATHFGAAVDLEELEGPVYRSVGVQQPCGGFGLGIEHHEAHAVDGYDVDDPISDHSSYAEHGRVRLQPGTTHGIAPPPDHTPGCN